MTVIAKVRFQTGKDQFYHSTKPHLFDLHFFMKHNQANIRDVTFPNMSFSLDYYYYDPCQTIFDKLIDEYVKRCLVRSELESDVTQMVLDLENAGFLEPPYSIYDELYQDYESLDITCQEHKDNIQEWLDQIESLNAEIELHQNNIAEYDLELSETDSPRSELLELKAVAEYHISELQYEIDTLEVQVDNYKAFYADEYYDASTFDEWCKEVHNLNTDFMTSNDDMCDVWLVSDYLYQQLLSYKEAVVESTKYGYLWYRGNNPVLQDAILRNIAKLSLINNYGVVAASNESELV